MTTYTARNALHKPASTDVDFPGEMEANTTILDAAVAKRYETATRPPTVTDDSSAGYSAGSWWQYTTGPVLYRCVSATVGAAVWVMVWGNIVMLASGLSTIAGTLQVGGASGPLISANQINGGYNTDNDTMDIWINYLGYLNGVTRFRDFRIGDGKQTAIVFVDGSAHTVAVTGTFTTSVLSKASTFESTVASPTAPMVVASTGKVANLNVDLLNGLADTAFVKHSLVTAANDFLVASGNGAVVKKTLAETQNILGFGADGWIVAGETWTWANADDDPSYSFTITGDLTAKYLVNMLVKLTQTTVKYFRIVKVVYSSPNTTVTINGGTDYNLTNAAITNNYYSSMPSPSGYPTDIAKWTVSLVDASYQAQASPTQNVWYNVGTLYLDVPIGDWILDWCACFSSSIATAGVVDAYATISTTNNGSSDPDFVSAVYAAGVTQFVGTSGRAKSVHLTAKTRYYLNVKSSQASVVGIYLFGNLAESIIRATPACFR
jgi:hypothetical protein